MKKLIALLSIFIIQANAYTFYDYIEDMADQKVSEFYTTFNTYNKYVLDTSAAMSALSNVDFNPDHQGLSIGAGYSGIDSAYGRGNGYAVGAQYSHENIAVNIKGAVNKNNDYILGYGLVIGF